MRAREFVTEAKTVDYEGLTLKVSKNDHELMVDALDDWGNKVLGHVKFNIGDGRELDPQDLRVDDRYQGQGIARVMYDYVKSLGYKIVRSPDQTDAGRGFWDKHRGQDVRVWEQGVAERKKSRRKKSSRHGGYFFPGYGYYGSSGDAGEGGGDGGGGESRSGTPEGKRIARKPGQPAGSKKHSDLYTDENPRGTITGLKFATVEDARASVSKIRNSGRSHAHKIQAAVAMEQRARAAGKSDAAAVYRRFIDANKKTEEQQLDELNFLGSECTKDCSGHRAGYEWSKRKGLRQANSWSPSFNKGAGLAVAGK